MEIVQFLVLEGGADVHAARGHALTLAAAHGHLDIAEFLVVHGKADVHASANEPLKYAAQHGHLPVVQFLLVNGSMLTSTQLQNMQFMEGVTVDIAEEITQRLADPFNSTVFVKSAI